MHRRELLGVLVIIVAATLVPLSVHAAEVSSAPTPPLVTIPNTAVHVVEAKQIDSVFRIEVALPFNYAQSNQSYPVIYLTDGNSAFPVVTGNMRGLLLGGEIPQAIIVGIGYEVANPMEVMDLRARDLTPTIDKQRAGGDQNNPSSSPQKRIGFGGAKEFLSFIDKEIKPFVDSHYRVDSDNQTLVGYSFGGLFTFFVLMNHTDSFDNYVVGSPSFWWDEGVSFRYEESYSKSHRDLPKTVFMSSGSLEESTEDPRPSLMVTNMKTMADRLKKRNYPSLELEWHVFDGETHMSGNGTAINRGLRFVLGKSMEIQGTEFRYNGKPRFTIEFPEGTTKADLDGPDQVFAATTPGGVRFQANVADILPAGAIETSAERYVASVVSGGVGSDPKISYNAEITLKDGTKAYRSEIQWFYIPAGVRLMTQMVSAYKDGKLVYITAHPLADPESTIPIVESLRFE